MLSTMPESNFATIDSLISSHPLKAFCFIITSTSITPPTSAAAIGLRTHAKLSILRTSVARRTNISLTTRAYSLEGKIRSTRAFWTMNGSKPSTTSSVLNSSCHLVWTTGFSGSNHDTHFFCPACVQALPEPARMLFKTRPL